MVPDMDINNIVLSSLPFFYLLFMASVTPGPNNVMLTASGMNFGYWRTLPHIAGIMVGFTLLIVLCTYGVGGAYHAYPPAQIALKLFGAAYLVYLAWRIYNAGRMGLQEKAGQTVRPLSFIEAFGFQFINPKGVIFSLTAVNLIPEDANMTMRGIIAVVATFICGMIATNAWALFGTVMAHALRDDKTRRIINTILALLLLATIPMMLH